MPHCTFIYGERPELSQSLAIISLYKYLIRREGVSNLGREMTDIDANELESTLR